MNMIQAIELRRSIRKYKDKDVPKELVTKMLESARLAPSGNNTQPWQFIIVRDPELRKKFQIINHDQKWISSAPLLIVCIADIDPLAKNADGIVIDDESPEVEVKKIIRDTAIAIDHLVLTATELGLSTCLLAWFGQKDIRPLFDIPPDKYVVAVITVGYGDEKPDPRPRKDLSELVHNEKWGIKG